MSPHEQAAMEASYNEEFDGIEDMHDILLHIWKAARAYVEPAEPTWDVATSEMSQVKDQTLEEAAREFAEPWWGKGNAEGADVLDAYFEGAQFQAARATQLVEALEKIADVVSAFNDYRNVSYSDWELRLIAREALATYRKENGNG